jgi:hypothetical protein
MYDYQKRIAELEDVRRRAETDCSHQRRLLGQRMLDLPAASRPPEAEPLVQRWHDTSRHVEEAGSAIERMVAIDDRQAAIRGSMKELQKERDALYANTDAVYEQVGAVAFRLFREHPLIDASYSAAFAGLARYQDQMRSIDAGLDRVHAEPQGTRRRLLDRIGVGSRKLILQNRKNVREGQLPRLLQEAGKELAETDFIDQMDDDELRTVSEPLRAIAARREAIDAELAGLREESGALLAEFNRLSDGKKLPRAQKDRESEIDAARAQLDQILTQLGTVAVEAAPDELSDGVSALQACGERVDHYAALIERLRAGERVIALDREITGVDAEISGIEGKLAELKAQRKHLEKERSQAEKARGAETDLFDN